MLRVFHMPFLINIVCIYYARLPVWRIPTPGRALQLSLTKVPNLAYHNLTKVHNLTHIT